MINRWTQWSETLGLVENQHKICLVTPQPAAKRATLAEGAREQWFVPSARILGALVLILIAAGHLNVPQLLLRINETMRRVQKAPFLPVTAPLRLQVLAYVALPKVTWGCWFFVNMQPWATLQNAINECMNFWHSPAIPALTALLADHPTQAKMRAILDSISALHRTVANGSGPQWRARPKHHTWQHTVARHLRKLGWQSSGRWKWEHGECGEIDIMNDLQGKEMKPCTESGKIGEGSFLANGCMASNRRELQQFPNLLYEEERIFAVRKAYHQSCVH